MSQELKPNDKLASVHTLPDKSWNAKACFGDALERADLDSPALALWTDKDGECHWSGSCSNSEALWMLHQAIKRTL